MKIKSKVMNRLIYIKVPLIIAIMAMSIAMQAQKKRTRNNTATDSLAALREFVNICNVYKKLPLYLDLEIVNSTNFITGEEDTTRSPVLFYMKPGTSYVKFGETEQLVNDSMALLVSNQLQRMILYSNAQPVLQRMKAITGVVQQDSSLRGMAGSFTAQMSTTDQQTGTITLTGRGLLYGTSLPKESVELSYNKETMEPLKVTTLKRALLPLKEDEYKMLSEKAEMAGKLVTNADKGHFLVKEQSVSFIYKKIGHDAAMAVPATIADRLIKDDQGQFIPVKTYEGYAVTIN
jgi:hypothetical protein